MEASSADRALERLKLGNERFVSGRVDAVGRDMARLGELVGGQHPFAAVLGCADSRVVHFGLGAHTEPILITVRWPSGNEEDFPNLLPNTRHQIVEGTGSM